MSDDSSRGFDWGPPDAGRFESLKEWGVYVLLILLIGGGIWFLVDAAGPGGQGVSSDVTFAPMTGKSNRQSASNAESISSRPGQTANPSEMATVDGKTAGASPTPLVPAKPVYLIQLGAFGEEQAAVDAQAKLRKKGYVASLTVPSEEFELYRLLLGPFSEEKQADETARKLNEMDFPCFVIESL